MTMPRNRCCVRPCVIEFDDFDRADNTDLGSKWVEVAGDSEIISQELSLPAGAVVRTVKAHPVNHQSGTVLGYCRDLAVGKKYRIIINMEDYGVNDYTGVWGEMEITDAGEGELGMTYRLGTRAGGSDTILETGTFAPMVDPDGTLFLCRSEGAVYLTPSESPEVLWRCIADNGKRHAGMANSGGSTIEMDGFRFREHLITNEDCDGCWCECDGVCIPKELTLTIYAAPGDEICGSCLDGVSITLTYDNAYVDNMTWTGTFVGLPISPDFGCGGSTDDYRVRLECRSGDPGPNGELFFLCDEYSGWCTYLSGVAVDCDFTGPPTYTKGAWEASRVCSPLELIFPVHFCGSEGGDCEFYYVVTL